jgi:aconitate hydratase
LSIVKQAQKAGLSLATDLLVTPGSEQIRATLERDGHIGEFENTGARVLANACGPCIGQWKRTDINKGESNAILTSYNRNFQSRNDGNANTMNFLASPEIVTCMAFAGDMSFNPLTDTLMDKDGKPFKFVPPKGKDLPPDGFSAGRVDYRPPSSQTAPNPNVSLNVDPSSQRLQLLTAFDAWSGGEFQNLAVLVKVRGKCTTDHISAAGSWLKYKGHLENLSNNTLIGATNDDNGKVNLVKNQLTGSMQSIPDTARHYLNQNQPWMIIGDFNYGEGSAREHAALQPRYLGCSLILARSFARIHETNLKKQGILPLTFADPDDYSRIPADARISTIGLIDLVRNMKGELKLRVETCSSSFDIGVKHTMSDDQLSWFKHGSALNMIRAAQQ